MAWFAADASKAWAEKFFLICNAATLAIFLVVFITAGLYKRFDDRDSYAVVSALLALPNVVVPLSLIGAADRAVPWTRRFVTKSNVWNLIFGFIGNYFWTHYFYTMLGAKYTFDTYNLNGVPVPCYLATHAYFVFYHSLSSVVLRRTRAATKGLNRHVSAAVFVGAVLALAYLTALMETVTISAFPYYDFESRTDMYKVRACSRHLLPKDPPPSAFEGGGRDVSGSSPTADTAQRPEHRPARTYLWRDRRSATARPVWPSCIGF